MTRQVSGTLIAAAVALIFVALAVIFEGSTGIAGVFVMGMAGQPSHWGRDGQARKAVARYRRLTSACRGRPRSRYCAFGADAAAAEARSR
jgi:hypothetical protein